MTFRSIGTLASDLLAKLEIDGTATRGSNVRASGRSTAVKGVATDAGEGGATPVAYALANRGKRTRNGNGKKTGTEAPASADREDIVKQGKTAVNLRVVSDNRRCMPRQSRTVPRRGLGIHLRLVASH